MSPAAWLSQMARTCSAIAGTAGIGGNNPPKMSASGKYNAFYRSYFNKYNCKNILNALNDVIYTL